MLNIMAAWLLRCHVKQRGNRFAIDSIGQKTGVIVIPIVRFL